MRISGSSLLLALTPAGSTSAGSLKVKTTSGTYTGLIDSTSAPDVNQWLGIPYAQPPIGTLRFMPPEPAPDYGNSLTAQSYKPVCFQNSGAKSSIYWQLIPEFLNRDEESEDCLYLNIWAPRQPRDLNEGSKGNEKGKGKGKDNGPGKVKKVPVIIWVVGGGFKEGGGHALYQVPDQWVQRMQTHIVVTFNYRLHVFGFPGSPAAYKNAGLMDVRLVTEWVRGNIAGFGGDPSRIFLYGQSAGANIVLSYSYAYPSDPIVAGFIATSSGTPFTNPTSSPNFHNLVISAGCANVSTSPEDELLCMQSLPATTIQSLVNQANTDPFRGLFRPIADNITLFTNLTERLEKGLVARLPLIGGFTYNEQALFLPFDPNMTTAPPAVPVPGGDGLACGIKREIDRRNTLGAGLGLRTYRYLFSGDFTNITPRYWLGGMHSSDIPLVFGTHAQFRGNSTELEWQTSYAMQEFWVSFASNPSADPRGKFLGQTWPQFKSGPDGKVMVFGNATGESPSYIAPVSTADKYSGAC